MSHSIGPCQLCGSESSERAMQLVEWREPVGTERWSSIAACRDRAACRSRVELVLAEPWPINDRTPAPARPTTASDPAVPGALVEASPWHS